MAIGLSSELRGGISPDGEGKELFNAASGGGVADPARMRFANELPGLPMEKRKGVERYRASPSDYESVPWHVLQHQRP